MTPSIPKLIIAILLILNLCSSRAFQPKRNPFQATSRQLPEQELNKKSMSPSIDGNNTSKFITVLDDDSAIQNLKTIISSSPMSMVIACASFVPKCKKILSEIESLQKDFVGNLFVFVLQTDESDEVEELAIELGLKDIPSYQLYKNGKLVYSSKDGEIISIDGIRDTIRLATSVVNIPAGYYGQSPTDPNDILKLVSQSYANTVNKTQDCCVSVDPSLLGYSVSEILKAGQDANLGLGCGNPLSFAGLKREETVVDLGAGAGIDCFLAADTVKKVIGIDMTPDMVHTARNNAKKRGLSKEHVQFRLGEIEHLPVADSSVDCVMSNCVINLSPDKPQVFREIYRILRVGGRIAISDVVVRPEKVIPQDLQTAEALACWVSGAPELESLDTYLSDAGFKNINIKMKEESREIIKQWLPGSGAEDYVVSAEITAEK